MKNTQELLDKCKQNGIPVFVISGNDILAIPVLLKYLYEAQKSNCDSKFLRDFIDVIQKFIIYQEKEKASVKLPD